MICSIMFKSYLITCWVCNNVDEIYNYKSLHSSLDYRSHGEYETQIVKLKPADRLVQQLWGWVV